MDVSEKPRALLTIVVDDNDLDRYLVRRVMSKRSIFDVILEAPTGKDFLDSLASSEVLAHTDKPVLVLMDIRMPGMDGFETAQKLQELVTGGQTGNSIVVMMFTSSDNPADRARADELAIVKGFIVKPIEEEDLDAIVALCDQC